MTGPTADLVFLDLPRRLAKVNRALGGLSRRRWLSVSGGGITRQDPAALRRFAAN